jgi:hypothetical protein
VPRHGAPVPAAPSAGSATAVQVLPPSVVRSSTFLPTAQPCAASVKSTWYRAAGPAYCLIQLCPPSLVARIRPLPAAQPWLASANWMA